MKKILFIIVLIMASLNSQSQSIRLFDIDRCLLVLNKNGDKSSCLASVYPKEEDNGELFIMFDIQNYNKKEIVSDSRYEMYISKDGEDYDIRYMQTSHSFYEKGAPAGHASFPGTWSDGKNNDLCRKVLEYYLSHE